jgi:hypothetical protein
VLHALPEYVGPLPEIGIAVSLGVIVVTLAVTTLTSLRSTRS